jgi:hypothetical protein
MLVRAQFPTLILIIVMSLIVVIGFFIVVTLVIVVSFIIVTRFVVVSFIIVTRFVAFMIFARLFLFWGCNSACVRDGVWVCRCCSACGSQYSKTTDNQQSF